MTRQREPDWQPRSDEVQSDQVASYDAMREGCPIAYDGNDSWTVFGHADAVAVADDTATYSNAVSRHLQVPNGFDGAAHRDYRTMIGRYFTDDAIAGFEPTLRSICADLVTAVPRGVDVDLMAELAEPFANDTTCAFMAGRIRCVHRCGSGRRRTAARPSPSTARRWPRSPSSSTTTSAPNSTPDGDGPPPTRPVRCWRNGWTVDR
ncbi:hypothetical protein [Rhodococcus sp. RD6.2]|uniref:hypothetical protein n=1 Tax=Rhodococcus sp. RD6.2 TaxID=260936 RepID=UPI00209E4589|nr:hypothetical protein [Rhodococcus sp. RD6.2]